MKLVAVVLSLLLAVSFAHESKEHHGHNHRFHHGMKHHNTHQKGLHHGMHGMHKAVHHGMKPQAPQRVHHGIAPKPVPVFMPPLTGKPDISFCNTTVDEYEVQSYSVTPDDIHSNENITIALNGMLTTTITKGSIAVKVKLGLIPVYSKTLDLCTELAAVNIKCPLPKGPLNIKETVAIPTIPISGKVSVHAEITDTADNKQMACLDVKVTV